MEILQQRGGVDVILCDLDYGGITALEFLHAERQLQQVRAVIICGDIDGSDCRRVLQIVDLTGLQFLGALASPLQPSMLKKAFQRYKYPEVPYPSVGLPPCNRLSERDLQQGLALGEFTIWLQPKVDMDTGALIGLEALARWNHPRRGVLLPQDFLPAILAHDLLDELFRQLLEQGLQLIQALSGEARLPEIAFNLHATQLTRIGLVDLIAELLEQYQVPAAALMFEIAEHDLLRIPRTVRTQLHRLYALGCRLAIDDFGSGFTSLKQLCQLPITQLVLGQEFTSDFAKQRNRAVVLSAVSIAESLDVRMVAKGVSTEVARDNLLAMGCLIGQGFYMARPMSVADFVEWLAQREQEKGGPQ
ncbi:MAG: EAL domain-containing protein [Pseudomonas sp.]|uniref:EAL domain-containing response regulator n=1 Tax=Pseudomonas sp. TaxID=306 RepID=UPI003D134E64